MTNQCERCNGSGWVTMANALCTDDKRRAVRCKCPACNCGPPEVENECARAVQEFIQSHHNPIVAEKNAEIDRLWNEVRKARAILHADGREAPDVIFEDRVMYRDAREKNR